MCAGMDETVRNGVPIKYKSLTPLVSCYLYDSQCLRRGRWSLITFIFAITAFTLMLVAESQCNFIKYVSTGGTSKPIVREFGIWHYRSVNDIVSSDGNFVVESCHRYPDSTEFDVAWNAARAFSIIVFIFAIIAIIVKCTSACLFTPDDRYRSGSSGIVTPLYLLLGILQGGLTFLLLDSNACNDNTMAQVEGVTFEDQCSLSAGAKLSISAMVFWLAAGVTSFLEGKAWQSECEERRLASSSVLPEVDSQATKPLLANHGFLKRASSSTSSQNKRGVSQVEGSMHSNEESQATDLTEPLSPSADYGFLRRASSLLLSRNREREVPDGSPVPSEAESQTQAADLTEPSANYGFLRRASSNVPSRNREGAISNVNSVVSETEPQVTDQTEPLVPTANYGFLRRASSGVPSRNREGTISDMGSVISESEALMTDRTEPLAPSASHGFLAEI